MPILKELPVIVCVCHVPDIDEINIHEHTNKNKKGVYYNNSKSKALNSFK